MYIMYIEGRRSGSCKFVERYNRSFARVSTPWRVPMEFMKTIYSRQCRYKLRNVEAFAPSCGAEATWEYLIEIYQQAETAGLHW